MFHVADTNFCNQSVTVVNTCYGIQGFYARASMYNSVE